jgi:hypothetical protein
MSEAAEPGLRAKISKFEEHDNLSCSRGIQACHSQCHHRVNICITRMADKYDKTGEIVSQLNARRLMPECRGQVKRRESAKA